ncbi:hypothetical protein V1517DRAFT_329211 [Lipomyces orientalis]|uniref:Uncharacterized protein n=1 Tax=Lipomyces orientalis TaxID=1233043 RepID=A0ACC3TI07_9ASCO
MLFRNHDQAAAALERLANSNAAQRLANVAEAAAHAAPLKVPLPQRESLIHEIVAPSLLIIGLITIAVIGFIVLRCVRAVLLSFGEALESSSIKFSSNAVSIPVQTIPQEKYVDITRRNIYSLWMNSSAPGFKSRYWQLRDERPRPHHYHRRRVKKRLQEYWNPVSDNESDSSTSASTSSQYSETEINPGKSEPETCEYHSGA